MHVRPSFIPIIARRIASIGYRGILLIGLLLASLIGPLGSLAHAASIDNPAEALTEAEQQWLAEHHTVRARVADFPPYQMTQPSPSGQSVDLLSSIAKRYGFKVEYLSDRGDFLSAQQDVMGPRQRIDMLLTMNRTEEREQQFALTDDYLSMPWVIYTRDDSPFISNVAGLAGKLVSVEKGFVVQEKLRKDEPSIRFLVEPNSEEALRAVATGRADAYVGNLAVATFLVRRFGLANLVVAAPTHYGEHKQAMAIRKDWTALRSIIDKGMATMPVDERNRLTKKWAQVETRAQIDYTLAWEVLIAASLLIAAFFYWNRRLANEVGRRKASEIELATHRDRLELLVEKQITAEKKIRESEERYRLLAENSHDVIWTMDVATRRLTYVSPSIQQLRGFTVEEVMAQPPVQALTPDSQKVMLLSFQNTLNRILAGERHNLNSVLEVEQPHRDGHIIPTEIVTSWLFDEADQPQTVLGVTRDITERRKAQEGFLRMAQIDALTGLANQLEQQVAVRTAELTQSNAQLTQEMRERQALQKLLEEALQTERQALATQRQFVAMLSHEFRTPLAIIDATTQRLDMQLEKTQPELMSRTDKIHRAIQRLLNLLENCLAENRLAASDLVLHMEHLDLCDFLRHTYGVDGLQTSSRIHLELPVDAQWVNCDRHFFDVALSNLVGNALKYSPIGSLITISLRVSQVDGAPDQILVQVVDQGHGVTQQDRERIFEKFRRGENNQNTSGAGLGLHLARELARRHGGDVVLEPSSTAPGTTFTLSLPRQMK